MFAYLGHLKGYQLLSDAANDPELIREAEACSREAGEGLCKRYGFDPEEQRQFAAYAIAKYRKREIVDPIERNARDPARKLSRNDRLVGPACIALEEGIRPSALSRAIAAGLLYDNAGDPGARKIQALIQRAGLAVALREICGITDQDDLAKMIGEAYGKLSDKGQATSDMQGARLHL